MVDLISVLSDSKFIVMFFFLGIVGLFECIVEYVDCSYGMLYLIGIWYNYLFDSMVLRIDFVIGV